MRKSRTDQISILDLFSNHDIGQSAPTGRTQIGRVWRVEFRRTHGIRPEEPFQPDDMQSNGRPGFRWEATACVPQDSGDEYDGA